MKSHARNNRMSSAPYALLAILISTASIYGAESPSDQLVTYPAPTGTVLNTDFSVKVRSPGHDWQDLADYLVKIQAVKDN